MNSAPATIRFQQFTLRTDPPALFRAGQSVELPAQPLRLLALLAARPGEVVSHAEIRQHLWPDRVVDFDNGLHVCIRQVRSALGDHAEAPRFVMTVPRRGYRFLPDAAGPRRAGRLRWALTAGLFAAVAAAVGPDAPVAPVRPTATELRAQDALQRGRYVLQAGGEGALTRSRAFFEEAIAADPASAAAHAALADNYVRSSRYDQAFHHARRAVALNPRLPDGHLHLGAAYALGQWDWSAAEQSVRRALDLGESAEGLHALASVYAVTGRLDQALVQMERALTLDPVSTLLRADYGFFLYYAGDLDHARRQCEAALELDPDHHPSRICLFKVAVQAGEIRTALAWASIIMDAWDADPALSARIRSQPGMTAVLDFERWRLATYRSLHEVEPVDPMAFAMIHAALGDQADALTHLESAARARSPMTPFVLADPVFDGLRHQPRFKSLMAKMGVQPSRS